MTSCERKRGKNNSELLALVGFFYVKRELWKPKLGQTLQARQEIGIQHDPFAIFLGAKIPEKETDFDVGGHIPQEISRFCHHFVSYGDRLAARVRRKKYLKRDLEILILLLVRKKKRHSKK